jgi:hypothetical protein
MLDPKYTKAVSSVISAQLETSSRVIISGASLEYTFCDRTNTNTNRGNYFVSFGLPAEESDLPTTSKISLLYPELQQLNVDNIIIAQIPLSSYTEYVDARSIQLKVPLFINSASTGFTLFSSTYTSNKALKYGESSPLLGDNIAFLFSDNLNKPYTGLTVNELGQLISHSATTTWSGSTILEQRTSAVSYLEVQGSANAIGTDLRPSINYAVSVGAGYPSHIGYSNAYNYDIPAGFVVLDKGIIVLTHPTIVDNFNWNSGFFQNNTSFTGTEDDRYKIHFNTGATYNMQFDDLNTEFKTSVICMALNGEFYISNNPTWDRNIALSQFGNFNPLYITEIGMYNGLGEQVAIGKFSQPIRRYINDIFTFTITLNM